MENKMQTGPTLTKKERREQRKQEQRNSQYNTTMKKKTKTYILWTALTVIVAAVLFFIIQKSPAEKLESHAWTKGPDSAQIILTEFSDLQCPACQAYAPLLKQLHEAFPDTLQIRYKHFPLTSIHSNALEAAYATEAAGKQDAFWDMHDLLFEKQSEWSELTNPEDTFISYAQTIGLNIDQFKNDKNSKEVKNAVKNNRTEGIQKGVNSTPNMFINDTKIQNPQSFAAFKKLIELELSIINAKTEALTEKKDALTKDETDYHVHADFKVFIENKEIDFSKTEFQSTAKDPKHTHAHLHDEKGTIIHHHTENITLGEFFKSLNINLTDNCITLAQEAEKCNADGKTLKLFVNGIGITEIENYVIADLDKILITYGSENQETLQQQISSISDEACIYSETCPERGSPPTENCVGGLGSKCTTDEHPHDE